jgi:XTP/dITP diphosphohydrolase
MPEAVEDADTFEGNAVKKATHYSTLTGILTLADDSGLEVDALNGAPGVHSARFAGPDAKDHANNMKLQEELIGVPDAKRTARFRCVLALAKGSEVVATTTGTIEGLITTAPAGSNGFGYDPYFYLPDRGCTAAELSPEQKNKISHRGQALRAMRRHIENLTR